MQSLKYVQLPSLIIAVGSDPTKQLDVDDLDLTGAKRPRVRAIEDRTENVLHVFYRAHDRLLVQPHDRMKYGQEPQALVCLATCQLLKTVHVLVAQRIRMTLCDLIVQERLRLATSRSL